MARITSSARRRHLHAPASLRSTQAARWNTGPEEDFTVALKGRIPGLSGEVNLRRRGSDRSPAAKATTMLILVTSACLAAIVTTVICKFAAAPAILVAVTALAAFVGVLVTGTIISFRQGAAAQPSQKVAAGHRALGRGRPYHGNGTADDDHDQADV